MRSKAKKTSEYSQEALQGLTVPTLPERMLACFSELLVASRTYRVKVGIHEHVCTFVELRKALVKDMSKYIDRRANNKMPFCYILQFAEVELYLVVDTIKDMIVTGNGVRFVYASYEVGIYENS